MEEERKYKNIVNRAEKDLITIGRVLKNLIGLMSLSFSYIENPEKVGRKL